MKQTFLDLVLLAIEDGAELTDYELDTALDYYGLTDNSIDE